MHQHGCVSKYALSVCGVNYSNECLQGACQPLIIPLAVAFLLLVSCSTVGQQRLWSQTWSLVCSRPYLGHRTLDLKTRPWYNSS